MILKPLGPSGYTVNPFITHKFQSYDYTYLSASNDPHVTMDLAVAPPTNWSFNAATEPVNPDGIFCRSLFKSVAQSFYSPSSTIWEPTSSVYYMLGITQVAYGEGIQPGTFVLGSPSSTGSIIDDGLGNLFGTANTGSGAIGSIFYNQGVIILAQDTSTFSSSLVSQNGVYATTGSQFTIEFNATQTINENIIYCTIDKGEMNYSINPSMTSLSIGGPKVFDLFASGTLTPFMTTVGLYNSANQLLAIGKFPNPIKRAPDSTQTIIVKIDIG